METGAPLGWHGEAVPRFASCSYATDYAININIFPSRSVLYQNVKNCTANHR